MLISWPRKEAEILKSYNYAYFYSVRYLRYRNAKRIARELIPYLIVKKVPSSPPAMHR